ncbi:MAG: sigma-54 dependent transcriptional regulator [Planctomycetales bacterium]
MSVIRATRWILSTLGIVALFYALLVLGYVATSPDLGLRFFLVDEQAHPGLVIRHISRDMEVGIDYRGSQPKEGDYLLTVGVITPDGQTERFAVPTYLHFTRAIGMLRRDTPPNALILPGANPTELSDSGQIGSVAEETLPTGGRRWVEIRFQRPGSPDVQRSWLSLQPLPLAPILLSLVWFVLQLGIFSVGALACWTRPYDRSARLFFAMCVVTCVAFVGGYHWWVIVGNNWLLVPFCACVILVPVVTLHFFLVYPYPKQQILVHPKSTLTFLYIPPTIATLVITGFVIYSTWLYHRQAPAAEILRIVHMERQAIQIYVVLAALYFCATLAALFGSLFFSRDPIEREQVKWISWAGFAAILPVGYTLSLVIGDRTAFVKGDATVPMFVASLLFMLAYAIGMLRYKLMLVDQLFSRESLYLLIRAGITVLFSLTIAVGSLVATWKNTNASQNWVIVTFTLMLGVILIVWLYDRLQQTIDRWFFREKYQLDKSLQRMQQTLGDLMEPALVAERMLGSCREVLLVDDAALYLREYETNLFRQIHTSGTREFVPQLTLDEGLIELLQQHQNVQRGLAGSRGTSFKEQRLLKDLNVEVLHVLEVDGTVAALVLLGGRRDGNDFTAEDLTFLTAMGQVAGAALHSAKIHKVVDRLNIDLQSKVDKIAEQQRMISQLQTEITIRRKVDSPDAQPQPEQEEFRRDFIRGSSTQIQVVLDTVRKVAKSQSSVLIRGESGTGKELIAQALHENSTRREGPLVRVHCGALAPGLLESELFGHVKGAFTGAYKDKIGRFETAHGGTLFLDEIGDISLETQIKLLRVLQTRTFEPVGGTRTVQVDVRLIAATHQDLERLISEGRFREDLFYRLNVISITSPPLRDRKADILELSLHFLTRATERLGKHITHIDDGALEALMAYPWPGNIRELENVIERACVLAEEEQITLRDLPLDLVRGSSAVILMDAKPRAGRRTPAGTIKAFSAIRTPADGLSERERLVQALQMTGGNKAEAARLLGIPRSTFFSKLKKYTLD